MQQLHQGKGEEETMGTKARLRSMSCLARPHWLHNPASGQSHSTGGEEGSWARESQNAEGFPLPPLSTPLSNLALKLLKSPRRSAELEGATKTPR